jgi:hypothetical protein
VVFNLGKSCIFAEIYKKTVIMARVALDLVKEDITVSISGDIVRAIQRHYEKEDYSSMIENFFFYFLPRKRACNDTLLSSRLRGCASFSNFTDKTDKEIKSIMYQDKYKI